MFILLFYLTLIIGFIYGIFKILLYFSNSFLLIDEYFVSQMEKFDDEIIHKYLGTNAKDISQELKNNNKNKENKINEPNQHSEKNENNINQVINKYLRLDFIISLTLGIIWFIFPILVINLPDKKKTKEIGKYLGLFTLISGCLSLFSIKKKDDNYKQKVFIIKMMCCFIVLLSFLIIISFTKKIEIFNIISIIFVCIWFSNNYIGFMESIKLKPFKI